MGVILKKYVTPPIVSLMAHKHFITGIVTVGGVILAMQFFMPTTGTSFFTSECESALHKSQYMNAQNMCLNGDVTDLEILNGIIALIKTGNFKIAQSYIVKIKNTPNKKLQAQVHYWNEVLDLMNRNPEEAERLLDLKYEQN